MPSASAFLRLEHALRFAFRAADRRFLVRFGGEDHRFLVAFGEEDGALLLPFGEQDLFALLALGAHLAFHRVLDVFRREDVLHFDAGDLDAPGVGGRVEDDADLVVDDVAGGQGFVEVEARRSRCGGSSPSRARWP